MFRFFSNIINLKVSEQEFFLAAQEGGSSGLKMVSRYMEQNRDIPGVLDVRDRYDRTALLLAIWCDNTEIAQKLLSVRGIDINHRPHVIYGNSLTALDFAASNGNETIVRMLLEIPHINLGSVSHFGNTALHYAARKGNIVIVNMLLERFNLQQINVNTTDGKSAADIARTAGHNDVVVLISERIRDLQNAGPEGQPNDNNAININHPDIPNALEGGIEGEPDGELEEDEYQPGAPRRI